MSFINNNVKELKSSKKRLKLSEYFKDKIEPFGIIIYTKILTITVKTSKNEREHY